MCFRKCVYYTLFCENFSGWKKRRSGLLAPRSNLGLFTISRSRRCQLVASVKNEVPVPAAVSEAEGQTDLVSYTWLNMVRLLSEFAFYIKLVQLLARNFLSTSEPFGLPTYLIYQLFMSLQYYRNRCSAAPISAKLKRLLIR